MRQFTHEFESALHRLLRLQRMDVADARQAGQPDERRVADTLGETEVVHGAKCNRGTR